MAWLKVDDRVRTHPKIVQAGPTAAWLWFCGICYCREHLTDGFISDKMLPTLVPGMTGWKRPAAALVEAGLWHRHERGYQVHDFLDWNPSKAEVEAQRAEDRARKRGGIPTDSNRNPVGIPVDSKHTRDAHAGLGSGSLGALGSDSEKKTTSIPDSARSSLALSPLDFEKLQRFNAYVGARLRVPHKLHTDFVALLGGETPDLSLRAWYAQVDEEIEGTREAIVPDVWKWLTARFKDWAADQAGDPEMDKIMRWAQEGAR